VVSANVEYPTDSGLLARAVMLVGKMVRRIKAAGGAMRTAFGDATDEATTRVHPIGAKLKLRGAEAKQEARATVLRLSGELADLAHAAVADAAPVLANARVTGPTARPAAYGNQRAGRPWCGYGVLAHNLVKVARLEAKTAGEPPPRNTQPRPEPAA
jgi:transposase, IS5 family